MMIPSKHLFPLLKSDKESYNVCYSEEFEASSFKNTSDIVNGYFPKKKAEDPSQISRLLSQLHTQPPKPMQFILHSSVIKKIFFSVVANKSQKRWSFESPSTIWPMTREIYEIMQCIIQGRHATLLVTQEQQMSLLLKQLQDSINPSKGVYLWEVSVAVSFIAAPAKCYYAYQNLQDNTEDYCREALLVYSLFLPRLNPHRYF